MKMGIVQMRTVQVEFDDGDKVYTYLYDPRFFDLEVGDQVTVRGYAEHQVQYATVVGFDGRYQGSTQTIIGVPEMEDDDEED